MDAYDAGVERPYGLEFPDGLRKNDRLPEPVITPTTKATGGAHDERLTRGGDPGGRSGGTRAVEESHSRAGVFARGQELAAAAGPDPGGHQVRVRRSTASWR